MPGETNNSLPMLIVDGFFLPIVVELLIVLQKSGGAFAMSLWVETVCAVVINKNCFCSVFLRRFVPQFFFTVTINVTRTKVIDEN